jgi:hypothetical protein
MFTDLSGAAALKRLTSVDPCAHAVMTVHWPYLGRKIAYTVNKNPLFRLREVAKKAFVKGIDVKLRVYESAQEGSGELMTEAAVDARLWHDRRISVRALGQFRTYAPSWIQERVAGLMAVGKIKDAETLIAPYAAYAVHSMEAEHPRTIAIDFDGVLAQATEFDENTAGEPIEGAIDALHMLVDRGYDVVILSSRASTPQGKNLIMDWLDRYGAPSVRVTAVKVPAELYLDDRAVQFTNWTEGIGACLAKEPDFSEVVTDWLCRRDNTPMTWEASDKRYACTACGDSVDEWALARRVIYAYTPGDLVSVRTPTGTTMGTAHLIYRAGEAEEEALGGSGLWLARFADGMYLPVGEETLSKLGNDEDARIAACAIVNSRGRARPTIGPKGLNLDAVAETALTATVHGVPADVALATVAARYQLSANELDVVGMTALGLNVEAEDAPLTSAPVYEAVCEALSESDRYFKEGGLVPTAEDEGTLVLGYLAEAFHWQDELLDERAVMRVAELTRLAREAQGDRMGHNPPAWVNEDEKAAWAEAVVAAGPGAGYAAITDLFRSAKQPKKPEPPPLTPDPDNKEYTNVSTPSLTSVPESDYDVVRFQTVAKGEKPMSTNLKRFAAEGLRPYGPGKFNTVLDSLIYYVANDHTADIVGDSETGSYSKLPWITVEELNDAAKDDQGIEPLTPEEVAYVNKNQGGYIMSEDSQGFVTIQGYADESERDSEFDRISNEVNAESGNVEASLRTKAQILDAILKSAKLSVAQRDLATEIRANLDKYDSDYIDSLGGLFAYEWDPGSMWEVRDVSGKRQIVRVDRPIAVHSGEEFVGKHAYKVGQELILAGSVVPETVKITALLGDEQYKVKSLLDGCEHNVEEMDLMRLEDSQIFN